MNSPNELPSEYLDGADIGTTPNEIEAAELAEYRAVAEEEPYTAVGSTVLWGNQVCVGWNPFTRRPMHLPFRAFAQNLSVRGAPGTGKTTRVVLPCTIQAINNRNIKKVYAFLSGHSPDVTASLEIAGYLAGRRVRRITNVPGKATYGFPALRQVMASGMSVLDIAALIVDAAGYNHGSGADEDFFRAAKEITIATNILPHVFQPGEQNFKGLLRAVMTADPVRQLQDAYRHAYVQLLKTFAAWASANFLNCEDGATVDVMRSAVSDVPELLIVEMVREESGDVAQVCNRFLLALLAKAIQSQPRSDDVRFWIAVDEAHNFFPRKIINALDGLRTRGAAIVYAFQHLGQLSSVDLAATLENCTATKIALSCDTVADMEFHRAFGGDALALTSQSFRTENTYVVMEDEVSPTYYLSDEYHPRTVIRGEVVYNRTAEPIHNTVGITPRFSNNDQLALVSMPGHGFIRSTLDREFWQQAGTEVPAFFDFCMTPAERKRRAALPWVADPGTTPVAYSDAFGEFVRTQIGKGNLNISNRWSEAVQHAAKGQGPRPY